MADNLDQPPGGHRIKPGIRSAIRSEIRSAAKNHPNLKRGLVRAELGVGLIHSAIAQAAPSIIRARPQRLTVAITAHCNLRCIGCRYGRSFMVGEQLPLKTVIELLDDAKETGVELVRLYGGEPLLHPGLPKMVEHAVGLGLSLYVTTNGILLGQKIDELYKAGLRNLSIGFYGTSENYNKYVQKGDAFRRLEQGLAKLRSKYPDISLQLNYLIMRPSCNLAALEEAWKFARRFDMSFHTDLVHYSLPYFTEGGEGELQFVAEDEPKIREFVNALLDLKKANPVQIKDSFASLRSIPDWLLQKAGMKIPCDAGNLLWVGADGTVQLCYVTFKLGNIFDKRLKEMVFSSEHHDAARNAFLLNCPNCHCERNNRIQKHLPSLVKYGRS